MHQTALALANNTHNKCSYDLGNFAVDGATTADLSILCPLDKVLPTNEDHPATFVHQLKAAAHWQPDIAVLSVGGNNYREALSGILQKYLTPFQLFSRITPDHAKPIIKDAFNEVKLKLFDEYKAIIDDLIRQNSKLNRIVLLSQYYPAITDFTSYFIYTGFSHVARAENKGQTPFALIEETMNELYRNVLRYAATKNKEIVFVDVTSSLNPLGGNHTHQIEPNEHGSKVMGKLIAEAIEYTFPAHKTTANTNPISMLRMDKQGTIYSGLLDEQKIQNFSVKKINHFISEHRYQHVGLFFSPSSSLSTRYQHAYELIMGKQFDREYTGLFAFGVLDLSLITIMASYLWRVAMNEKVHLSLRVTAGLIAAPILLQKMILGLTLMVTLALPIYGYHQLVNCFNRNTDKKEEPLHIEQEVPALAS